MLAFHSAYLFFRRHISPNYLNGQPHLQYPAIQFVLNAVFQSKKLYCYENRRGFAIDYSMILFAELPAVHSPVIQNKFLSMLILYFQHCSSFLDLPQFLPVHFL